MGVLKVLDGSVSKNIGCGGALGEAGRLKVRIGTRWVREVCDADVDSPEWLRDNSGAQTFTTIAPTTGSHTSTFTAPVTLTPGIDYWYILQNCAANAQAQATGSCALTGLTATPGALFSFSGGGFGSTTTSRYPIFQANAASGTSPAITYPTAPDDFWGPTTIAQKFQVTAPTVVTGLTQLWGSIAGSGPSGKWGLASNFTSRHPLKAWTGSAWDQVACMVPAAGEYGDGLFDDAIYG